jgi:hypothetical protein
LCVQYATGEHARFTLLWELAPAVCKLLAEHLPTSGRAIHGIYSGTIVGVLLSPDLDAPLQNATTCHLPGDLMWMHYDELSRFEHPEAVSEIYWAYDRHARSVVPGQFVQVAASVFARVDTSAVEWPAFAARSAQVRWDGAADVTMTLVGTSDEENR